MEFASEEDLNKALELNGKKVLGQEIKLDRAHSKENAQESRKGNLYPHAKLQTGWHLWWWVHIDGTSLLTLFYHREGYPDTVCEKSFFLCNG